MKLRSKRHGMYSSYVYLWIAPILVQASIEATAIGDVGM